MITDEQVEDIINKAVERALMKLPDVVGTLFTNVAKKAKLSREFYNDHPEFKNHIELVVSICEQLEGQNPNRPIADILKDAVPEIQKKIGLVKNLEFNVVDQPKTNFHGEL